MVSTRLRSRLSFVVVIAACAVAVAAASGFQIYKGKPIAYSSHIARPGSRSVPRGTTPRDVLNTLVARLHSPNLVKAWLGPDPYGFHFAHPTVWLYATVRAAAPNPSATLEPIWEANVLMGDLRDTVFVDGLRPVLSSMVSVRFASGETVRNLGGGIGNVRLGQVFSARSSAAVEARIRRAATRLGMTVESLKVLDADQPAPAVVVRTSRASTLAAGAKAIAKALFGPPGTVEAYYLRVEKANGAPAYLTGAIFRTGIGMGVASEPMQPSTAQTSRH